MCSVRNDRFLPSSAALRPINQGPTASDDDPPIARLFVRNRAEYLMRKTRVTVGRSSAKSAADVDVGSSTYISRNHIEIYRTDSRFYVLVTGKNGLFVDGVFRRKGSAPFELQRLAILRFPSTDVTIQFHILVEDNPLASIKCPMSFMDEPIIKENGRSDVLRKPSSPVGKLPFGESQAVFASSELKQEMTCPVSIKSEETAATKSRNRETHARESKVAVFENGGRDGSKPTYSYAQLIVQAICSQKDRQLTLSGIYSYITKKFPYYRSGDKGWQNSIRHNLSLNRYFIKVPRAQEESGKGSFWKIDPSSEAMLIEQAFKKRRQRTTQASNRMSQGESTPSYASMSSVEVDGSGTPEDSCLSWEGATFAADETKELVIAEDVKPSLPTLLQENGGMAYETRGDQIFKDTRRQVAAPSYAHHALPQLLTRPQFFIAKPSDISGTLAHHLPGVVPLQLPTNMVSTASTLKSNDLEQKELIGNGGLFMVPETLPSSVGYAPRPAQIQGFHPKTVIVRMSSSGAISGANPVRLTFGMPALEAQNLLPVVGLKTDCEEMELEEMTTPVDDSRCVGYDAVSETRNAEMNCFALQTIAN